MGVYFDFILFHYEDLSEFVYAISIIMSIL